MTHLRNFLISLNFDVGPLYINNGQSGKGRSRCLREADSSIREPEPLSQLCCIDYSAWWLGTVVQSSPKEFVIGG